MSKVVVETDGTLTGTKITIEDQEIDTSSLSEFSLHLDEYKYKDSDGNEKIEKYFSVSWGVRKSLDDGTEVVSNFALRKSSSGEWAIAKLGDNRGIKPGIFADLQSLVSESLVKGRGGESNVLDESERVDWGKVSIGK